MWTAIRFLHVLSAIAWVGVQLTLFMLFPVLRRRLAPDEFRSVARAAGMRLGVIAAATLPTLLVTGLALASREVPRSERGWVIVKLVIWGLVLGAFAMHALTASRTRRVWVSAAMLVLSLGAVAIGAHLTEM
jgi:uncharacterized membrane protein